MPTFSELLSERYSHWAQQGLHGEALFMALAFDAEIAVMLPPENAAIVVGSTPSGLKQQRARNTGPPFVRLTGKVICYPRVDLFRYLARRYVRRAA